MLPSQSLTPRYPVVFLFFGAKLRFWNGTWDSVPKAMKECGACERRMCLQVNAGSACESFK